MYILAKKSTTENMRFRSSISHVVLAIQFNFTHSSTCDILLKDQTADDLSIPSASSSSEVNFLSQTYISVMGCLTFAASSLWSCSAASSSSSSTSSRSKRSRRSTSKRRSASSNSQGRSSQPAGITSLPSLDFRQQAGANFPPSALEALENFYTCYNAYPQASGCAHTLGQLASASLKSARITISEMLEIPLSELIFSPSLPSALSLLLTAVPSTAPSSRRRQTRPRTTSTTLLHSALLRTSLKNVLYSHAESIGAQCISISPSIENGSYPLSVILPHLSRTQFLLLSSGTSVLGAAQEISSALHLTRGAGVLCGVDITPHLQQSGNISMMSPYVLGADFVFGTAPCADGTLHNGAATFIAARPALLSRIKPPLQGAAVFTETEDNDSTSPEFLAHALEAAGPAPAAAVLLAESVKALSEKQGVLQNDGFEMSQRLAEMLQQVAAPGACVLADSWRRYAPRVVIGIKGQHGITAELVKQGLEQRGIVVDVLGEEVHECGGWTALESVFETSSCIVVDVGNCCSVEDLTTFVSAFKEVMNMLR